MSDITHNFETLPILASKNFEETISFYEPLGFKVGYLAPALKDISSFSSGGSSCTSFPIPTSIQQKTIAGPTSGALQLISCMTS